MEWVKQSGHRDDVIRNMMAMRAIVEQMKSLELLEQKIQKIPDRPCYDDGSPWSSFLDLVDCAFNLARSGLKDVLEELFTDIHRMFAGKVAYEDRVKLLREVVKIAGVDPNDTERVADMFGLNAGVWFKLYNLNNAAEEL